MRYPDQDENDKVREPGQYVDDLVRKLGPKKLLFRKKLRPNGEDWDSQPKIRRTTP